MLNVVSQLYKQSHFLKFFFSCSICELFVPASIVFQFSVLLSIIQSTIDYFYSILKNVTAFSTLFDLFIFFLHFIRKFCLLTVFTHSSHKFSDRLYDHYLESFMAKLPPSFQVALVIKTHLPKQVDMKRHEFEALDEKIPVERKAWQPLSVFLREIHGQRSPVRLCPLSVSQSQT